MPQPDFLLIGAPKAGSTALHDALGLHPQLYPAPVKEPKYFLSPDRPPDPTGQRGPGDAHSAREWVWRRRDYERLFAAARPAQLCYESTPFYLWHHGAHRHIAATLPQVKLIAVIRDPIERAYSNWLHLRTHGLEPEADFRTACALEPRRIAAGWAPFWRYLELGHYGGQLAHLFRYVDPSRIRVIRYRELVDTPQATLDRLCRFLGVNTGILTQVPQANVGRWSPDGTLNTMLRHTIRGGAALGGHAPPAFWRTARRPLVAALQRGHRPRPQLDPAIRAALVEDFAADNAHLSRLLGNDYSDWLSPTHREAYTAPVR